MTELSSPPINTRSNSTSPPPNCAICLGTCTNKCFSDSCMHQFCFKCLLEWSKVKAECPLCKQPFKSIIHNVKSNDEYDEHVITRPEVPLPEGRGLPNPFFYLPYESSTPHSRHFQFRTTFTVDPGGELAIQQMLLSHLLTNNMFLPDYNQSGYRYRTRYNRRASSATSFRRSIYAQNLWVYAPPDLTGRYRDVTPEFYRDNPAARNRLAPWLNRELNALLYENTQQVMLLVDMIMDHLLRHHIRSRMFRNVLGDYLGSKTNHFIHEFYNFMRSPYDMVGYDRHIIYSDRPHSPTSISVLSDNDDNDSDVAVIRTLSPVTMNAFQRPTIEVIEIDSESSRDSDVIIREPTPPEVVDLIDSDSDNQSVITADDSNVNGGTTEEDNRKPILPLKIRLKHKRQSREKRSKPKKRYKKCYASSSSKSSTSTGDDTSSTSSTGYSSKRSKRKRKYKKSSRKEYRILKESSKSRSKSKVMSSSSSDDEPLLSRKRKLKVSDPEDNLPLSKLRSKDRKKKGSKKKRKDRSSLQKSHTITKSSSYNDHDANSQSSERHKHISPPIEDLYSPRCEFERYPQKNESYTSSPPEPTQTRQVYEDSLASPKTLRFRNTSGEDNSQFENNMHCESTPQYHSTPQYETTPHYASTPQYANTSPSYSYPSNSNRSPVPNNNPYSPVVGYDSNESVQNISGPSVDDSDLYESRAYPYKLFMENGPLNLTQASPPKAAPYTNGIGFESPVKHEMVENNYNSENFYPGPSSSGRLRSVIIKKENSNNLWYSRPYRNCYSSDSSD